VCMHYHDAAWCICSNCSHKYSKKDQIDLRKVDKWDLPRLKRVNRSSREKEATPRWLTEAHWGEIKKLYKSRKNGEHVDHIVPLKGVGVCGLHVPWNLRVISAEENCGKSNTWWPNMWDCCQGFEKKKDSFEDKDLNGDRKII